MDTSIKVLVIDDEIVIRQILREFLEDCGYHVIEGVHGRDGVAKFHAEKPDVVLCDLRMPEMDGLAVLAEVKEERPGVPFIVVSGAGNMKDALEALRMGASDYLTKPVDLTALQTTVRRALDRVEAVKEQSRHHEYLEEEVQKRTGELRRRSIELEQVNASLRAEIAERLKAEEERRLLEADLRQAQKMEAVGTLAGGVAHDFNNLLTTVAGNLSLLRLESIAPNAERYITEAENACDRAASLVRQLLTLSRKTEAETAPIQLNAIVDEVYRLVSETFDRRIEIVKDLARDLPLIIADAVQVKTLLLNLCINARDAVTSKLEETAQEGSGDSTRARIYIRTCQVAGSGGSAGGVPSPRQVLLSVEDTGCGMPPGIMDRIFEPFFTTKSLDKGTGLGLSVAYGIVTKLGGRIEVLSNVGEGATFNVYFPVLAGTFVQKAAPAPVQAQRGGTETVLFVDDERAIRLIGSEYLGRLGYRVLVASNGQEGKELFDAAADSIDLAVLDLSMPVLSGDELLVHLRARRPGLRVIVCTGSAYAAARLETKVEACMLKPFRPAELASRIREVLDAPPLIERKNGAGERT